VKLKKRYPLSTSKNEDKMTHHRHRGLLLACGMVAGASVMGVILAIPFTLEQNSDALKIMPDQFHSLADLLSLLVTAAVCVWIYRVVMKAKT
jgi:hypothetical protein